MIALLRSLGSPLAVLLLVAGSAHGQALTISTLAGPSTGGGWVDAQGTAARFSDPTGIALEPSGSLLIADSGNHVIRRMTPAGVVTTVAGSPGIPGHADGFGTAARFDRPRGVAVDNAGVIYVADSQNHVIRRITPNGQVTTLAGQPRTAGNADGTGSAASFRFPFGVEVDLDGNVIVADTSNHTIRKITPQGVVTTIAGLARSPGSSDGFGSQARFEYPWDVAVDVNNNVFVADTDNHTIRRITPEGRVTTIAGIPGDDDTSPGTTDGTGTAARFNRPASIDIDAAGVLWVADMWNNTIRRVSPTAEVTTVAGRGGFAGRANGPGTTARFNTPSGIAVASNGFYIVDRYNQVIRFMTFGYEVSTIAGSNPELGAANGPGPSARFLYTTGVAVDGAGNVYVSEYADTIRKITPAGVVTTLAGLTDEEGSADGVGSAARFDAPQGIAADAAGNVYVADYFNHTIRKVTPAGVVTTIAGVAGEAGDAVGTATQARFENPTDVAVDNVGNVYVADTFNHRIKIIEPNGIVSNFAGGGFTGDADAIGTAARFRYPGGIALDAARNIYVADWGNHTIRKIAQNGQVTTVAGTALFAGHVDAKGAAARLENPLFVGAAPDGTLYVTEESKHSIRRIDPQGNVTTVAGVIYGPGNMDGTGSNARLFHPQDLAVDAAGKLYIADQYNHNVRTGTHAAPQIVSFTASPGSIDEGGSSTLSWNVANATSVTISGIGAVPASGTRVVNPGTTTTYTLTASGPGGTVTQTVTVRVGVPARRRSVRH